MVINWLIDCFLGSHFERVCEKYGRQEVINTMRKFNDYCIEREKEKNGKIILREDGGLTLEFDG